MFFLQNGVDHYSHFKLNFCVLSALQIFSSLSFTSFRKATKQLLLLSILILHLQKSELCCCFLDGMSALAWELLFPRSLGHLSDT